MTTFELTKDTPATQIHGITGAEVRNCILDAGTRVTLEREPLEEERFFFVVAHDDNCRYRIRKDDLVVPA